ncbi:MAG: hypothetical protein OWU33_02930 [Firmicutes bacterium]|nr:hypothetical protein [Bacillota bacterium]
MRRLKWVTLPLILLGLTGCASAATPPHPAPAVSRHEGGITITLRWLTVPTELRAATFRLTVSPPPSRTQVSGTLTMTEMSMPPVPVTWHHLRLGQFDGQVVPTMAGPWRLTLVIRATHRIWREVYAVNVAN